MNRLILGQLESRLKCRLLSFGMAVLVSALFISEAPAMATAGGPKHSVQSIEQIAKSELPSTAELIHKVVRVNLGKTGSAIVAVYRASQTTTNFSGLVMMQDSESGQLRSTQLPSMHEANGLFDIDVVAVFSSPSEWESKGLVILYRYYRLGSASSPKNAGYAYRWTGSEWIIDDQKSRLLAGVSTAQQARKKLESMSVEAR